VVGTQVRVKVDETISMSAATPTLVAVDEHACRWCHEGFDTVPELLDHVVDAHLADDDTVAA
jgi:tRNA U54 and U55 pseudouridine synthase Pus10